MFCANQCLSALSHVLPSLTVAIPMFVNVRFDLCPRLLTILMSFECLSKHPTSIRIDTTVIVRTLHLVALHVILTGGLSNSHFLHTEKHRISHKTGTKLALGKGKVMVLPTFSVNTNRVALTIVLHHNKFAF
jgi:hypothetical protein